MSTLAEQVVEQLKTDMDNVYDAGYQKGLKEIGGGDISKFGIQNEVTGTGLVTCDYVNENEHNVEVRLSSDTVADFSGVEVDTFGKNFSNNEWVLGFINTSTGEEQNSTTCLRSDYIKLPQQECIIGGLLNYTHYVFTYDDNKQFSRYLGMNATKVILSGNERYIRIGIYNSIVEPEYTQVELGTVETPYEPYKRKTYTANADGTVDGVTSISPTMNIICEGVGLSAKYYCCPTVEYDRFWDVFQDFWKRTDYNNAFYGAYWNDTTFKPKYLPFKHVGNCNTVFQHSKITWDITEEVIDLTEALQINAIIANTKKIKKVVMNIPKATRFLETFYYATGLEELVIKNLNNSIAFSSAFIQTTALKKVSFINSTIFQSINLQWSNLLEVESAKNIIDCLADLTGSDTQTLTFHADVKAKLTEEQIATITSKNWTLA